MFVSCAVKYVFRLEVTWVFVAAYKRDVPVCYVAKVRIGCEEKRTIEL
jgi:hypothetical protein